jgi:alanine racemase
LTWRPCATIICNCARRLSPGVKLLAVVKADAYGHGLVPAARTLAAAGAEYLGVASLEEGLALRQEGLEIPILLLMGIVPQESQAAVAANLEVVLYRQDVAQALEAAARSLGKKARVHLKVDTGMGRLGVMPPEVLPFLESVKNSPYLEVLGLISHLAMADGDEKSYTRKQLEIFLSLLTAAREQGWELPYSHIANSAALVELPEAHFGMARPGISLYGSPPSPSRSWGVDLKPVMSLTTQVLQLKRLPPGHNISYGGTYTTHGLVHPGSAAGGLLQRLSETVVEPGGSSSERPPGSHSGPGLHEPDHGGGQPHSGGGGGGAGHPPGRGRRRPPQLPMTWPPGPRPSAMRFTAPWGAPIPAVLWEPEMDRKPDISEPSICAVCAWRETCVKRFSFDGQHCLEYTRDVRLTPKPEKPEDSEEKK